MKLMPIKQAQAKLMNALSDKTLKAITLHTFKKDRSITLRRHENDGDGLTTWTLIEQGFEANQVPITTGSKDKRLIKEAFKREFPRSTRAYVSEER